MKVVILAGGFGTRLSEETDLRPKPMVEIGDKPILWHIMKIYSSYGFNEFIILLGYKGYAIKEYFANYFIHNSNITIDLSNNSLNVEQSNSENWKVTLIDTGLNTLTGGRIKRAREIIGDAPFFLTYGDGLSDVDIQKTLDFHISSKKLITMTAVKPAGRYGALNIDKNSIVTEFKEKPKGDNSWINGGFFVCEPEVLDYIEGDDTIFEEEPLSKLAREGNLLAYKHSGFWECMDTLRDKKHLSEIWESGNAPWKKW